MTQQEKDILKLRAESIVNRAFMIALFQVQEDRNLIMEYFDALTTGIEEYGHFSTMSDELLAAVKKEVTGFRPMVTNKPSAP